MFPEPNPAASELWFDVDFNAYVGGHYNRDLGGKGTLVVREAEPRFVFTGQPRGKVLIGKDALELAFRSDEIWNAVADGTGVQFSTARGKSGEQKRPFVFTCRSEREAATVVDALPKTKDADFLAEESFIERIRQLPDRRGAESITNLLLFANAAVFVAMGLLGAGWLQVESLKPYITYGANNAEYTTNGQWWRLVSCMFLHFGIIHLLLNAWALFQVGQLVEKLLGRALYTLVYFGSGVIGSLATLFWTPNTWSAGASGAVFGIFGALLGYLWREKHGVPAGIFRPLLQSTLAFAGYNLVFGAIHPNIDNAAHLGGLVGGVILGWTCALPIDAETRRRVWPQRAFAGVSVAAVLVVLGAVAAYRLNH